MARLDFPANGSADVERVLARLPAPINLARMSAHSPDLAVPFMDLGLAILSGLSLSPRHRELVVLLVARHTGCAYEWAQHVPIARAAGVADVEVANIATGVDSWESPQDRALAASVADLLTADGIGQAAWQELATAFSATQIVEICLVAGYYRMVAGLLNALEVDVDPQGESFVGLAAHR